MPHPTDRRRFLQTTGALGAFGATGAAGLLAACGSDGGGYSAAEQRSFSVAETVSAIAQGRIDAEELVAAGVVLVDVDLDGLAALNDQVSFQIALHEPIADLPAWLAANGAGSITLADVAAGVASPDVKAAFSAILADAFGAAYPDAINVYRPRMQALYAACFADDRIDALLFPTTVLPATTIDAVNGSSTVSINGGPPLDTFGTYIRNTDPGSNAGLPGLSLPAGLTAAGLPVGLELDGPVGSDRRLIAIGLAIEALLGPLRAPG